MKVFLQNDEICRVVTVLDGDIDLDHYDEIWDVWLRTEFAGNTVDVCVTGDKTTGERPHIDYDAPVTVEAYGKEGDNVLFRCRSPIVTDEHTRELHPITPDELNRRMARIALPVMAGSPYIRDFAYHHAGYVRRTGAKHPFLWLVRGNGTTLYDLTAREDVSGFTACMDMYRGRCCLFHFDGCDLRPVTPETARAMLDKLTNKWITKMRKTVCKRCGSEEVAVTVTINPNDAAPIADYCRRDETITEDGWCNCCGNYVELETTESDVPTDFWRCERCGSTNVQERVWRFVNTGEIINDNSDKGDYFCENCDGHNRLVRESELLRKAKEWWGEADFRQMERVTGCRQLDFDPEDGCQAFVDACGGWWNEKTTDDKISIYLNNQ